VRPAEWKVDVVRILLQSAHEFPLNICLAARRLLKSLSIKQGIKYDAPESALDIPTFIEFHGLKVEEILDPLDSFSASFPLVNPRKILTSHRFHRKLQRILLPVHPAPPAAIPTH
jgi:hypothetical protein